MAAKVSLDTPGGTQLFVGVNQVFFDVQYDARVTNDTSALGGAAARPVYLSRRDPTGGGFTQSGALAPGATSGTDTPNNPAPPPPTAPDWFDAAFNDAGLRSLARSLAADGGIDRADVFQLFTQVERDATVSAAEFNDLGDLVHPERVAGSPGYSMPDPVRFLTTKVVDGDPANRTFQGIALGNLQAGSSAGQFDKLVGKWFLGTDRPLVPSSATYRPAGGALFQSGPAYADIRQGNVGDCYYVAALGEIAQWSPQRIVDMFTDNRDGTYTVRFYRSGVPQYVTVDRYLPTDSIGRPVYARFGVSYDSPLNELWVALAEKAYAQLNHSGWIGQDGTNSYAGIADGYSDIVMQQVTGRAAAWTSIIQSTAGQLSTAAASDLPTVLGSLITAPGNGVVANHGYGLVGYTAATGKFTLFNPQGGTIDLTWDQIRASFYGFWQSKG
jgi:hypothetical protein